MKKLSVRGVSKTDYTRLLRQVASQIKKGRARVEREKIKTYWSVGRVIDRFILKDQARAPYGKQIIERLTKDLKVSRTSLFHSLEFYRAYPIVRTSGQLTWSHYERLLSINNPVKRKALEKRAIKEAWSVRELRSEIQKLRPKKKVRPLTPKRGVVGLRRIKKVRNKLAWDLGFTAYQYIRKRPKKYKEPASSELFTFEGFVERVVDGDTVWCQIELGFNICVREKLRLRGINAPELKTKLGKKAKAFLHKILPKETFIVVRTSKSDKFDRYLADLFVGNLYINQLLIDEGFAQKV